MSDASDNKHEDEDETMTTATQANVMLTLTRKSGIRKGRKTWLFAIARDEELGAGAGTKVWVYKIDELWIVEADNENCCYDRDIRWYVGFAPTAHTTKESALDRVKKHLKDEVANGRIARREAKIAAWIAR
jgi:hypothetical protein